MDVWVLRGRVMFPHSGLTGWGQVPTQGHSQNGFRQRIPIRWVKTRNYGKPSIIVHDATGLFCSPGFYLFWRVKKKIASDGPSKVHYVKNNNMLSLSSIVHSTCRPNGMTLMQFLLNFVKCKIYFFVRYTKRFILYTDNVGAIHKYRKRVRDQGYNLEVQGVGVSTHIVTSSMFRESCHRRYILRF